MFTVCLELYSLQLFKLISINNTLTSTKMWKGYIAFQISFRGCKAKNLKPLVYILDSRAFGAHALWSALQGSSRRDLFLSLSLCLSHGHWGLANSSLSHTQVFKNVTPVFLKVFPAFFCCMRSPHCLTLNFSRKLSPVTQGRVSFFLLCASKALTGPCTIVLTGCQD